MSNSIQLPEHYQPFEKLDICGNTLINGYIPIAVDGNPIFLIGKGEPPRMWLSAQNKDKTWSYIVNNGVSSNDKIRVLHSGKIVAIYLSDKIILQATKEDEDYMIISYIDLKPFGLSITGDITSLKVGTNVMKGNIFKNVETMVNVE